MNNLYLTLLDKAGEMCNGDLERESDVMFRYYAELIIKECLGVISSEATSWFHPERTGITIAGSAVKQHFGMEK